jgi:hypothetical protein
MRLSGPSQVQGSRPHPTFSFQNLIFFRKAPTIPRPARFAHKELDAVVACAYGWPADLTDEQVLEKLIALNLERAAEEAKSAQTKPPKKSREKQTDEMI